MEKNMALSLIRNGTLIGGNGGDPLAGRSRERGAGHEGWQGGEGQTSCAGIWILRLSES
jgi:hypothetical protein